MILPNTFISMTANEVKDFNELDSLGRCLDTAHFKSYPYSVHYRYNSRGFRDAEWPEDFSKCIWCLGDSFTCGLGQPFEHIWPQVLQYKTNIRTINVSLDGASNNWIARKAQEILKEFNTCTIVIHWSFLQRRELDEKSTQEKQWKSFYNDVKDPSWPNVELDQVNTLPQFILNELETVHKNDHWRILKDENRRLQVDFDQSAEQNVLNTLECIKSVESFKKNNKIIHSFIHDFAFMSEDVVPTLEQRLQTLGIAYIPEFEKIDLARDGFHYGKLTSERFVDQITSMM